MMMPAGAGLLAGQLSAALQRSFQPAGQRPLLVSADSTCSRDCGFEILEAREAIEFYKFSF